MEMSMRRLAEREAVLVLPFVSSLVLLLGFSLNLEHVCFAVAGLILYATICWIAPFAGLLLAVAAMPLAPRISFGFGNLYVGTMLVLLFEGVSVLRRLTSAGPLTFRRTALAAPFAFFAAALALSTAMNMAYLVANPDQLLRFVQFLAYFALFFFAADFRLTRSRILWTVGIVLATGVLEGGLAAYQWFDERGFFATGTFDGQHNHLAAYLVFTGLLFVGALIEARSARAAIPLLACIVLAALGLVFSFSRTGYIAIAGGMLFFTIFRISIRKKLAVVGVLLVGAGLAYYLVPSSVAERFGTIAVVAAGQTQKDISFTVRLEMWSEAIEAFKRSPILGTGAMTFQMRDNYFMKTLGESGLLGMTALLWMIFAVLRETSRAAKLPARDRLVKGARLGLAASSFALLVVFNTAGDFVNLHRLMGVYWVLLAVLTVPGEDDESESMMPAQS